MHYTIYKITNQIDGKIYIGSHKTKNLNDGYMGSGKYLKRAQDKYGIDKFTKEILFVFDTSVEMYAKEAEIVTEEFIATENTYNLKIGGYGGWDYVNDHPNAKKWRRAASIQGSLAKSNRLVSDSTREKISQALSGRPGQVTRGFAGKQHTATSKANISLKLKGRGVGSQNSNAKTVIDSDGHTFNTINECALFHNVHVGTVANRIKSGIYQLKQLKDAHEAR